MAANTNLPIKTLATTFKLLRKDPQTAYLTIPACEAMPHTVMDLSTLTGLLWNRQTDNAIRNAIWTAIVREVRAGTPGWAVVACGLACPALVANARKLRASFGGSMADVDAEVIEGFLAAVHTLDLADPEIESVAGALANLASNIARTSRRREVGELAATTHDGEVYAAASNPGGHPDFVLARAVRAGVITVQEAEYIGRTRLEERGLEDVGAELGVHPVTLFRHRRAAENRLVQALRTGAI